MGRPTSIAGKRLPSVLPVSLRHAVANEEIVEILLSKSKILPALRFAHHFIILFVVISDAVATLVALHTSKSVFYCCLKAMNELANGLSFMVGR